MTRDETKQIIRVISDTYPNWKPNNISSVVDTWYLQLQNDDYQLIATALIVYNRNNHSGFAPSIGQLLDIASNTILADDTTSMTESEAWARVYKAICNSTYHSKEEYDSLPPILQKAVGTAENLRSMATEENGNLDVMESNFRRTFNAVTKQSKTERSLLPMMDRVNQLRISNGISAHTLEARDKHENPALTVDELW